MSAVIDKADRDLQPAVGPLTQLIQQTAFVKYEFLTEAKDRIADTPEKAFNPIPVEKKPGLPVPHGLYAWEINRGFFRDDLIKDI